MQVKYSRIKIIFDQDKEAYERLVYGLQLDSTNLYISKILQEEKGLAIYVDTNYFKYERRPIWDIRRELESNEHLETRFKSALLLLATHIKYKKNYIHLVFPNCDNDKPVTIDKFYNWEGKEKAILSAITPKLDIFSNYLFNKSFNELLDKVEKVDGEEIYKTTLINKEI